MVLTPRFRLDQTVDHVIISIIIPYVRISTSEIVVEENHFYFHCSPYYLHLTFPNEFHDENNDLFLDETSQTKTIDSKAVYDPNVDHGTIKVYVKKKISGQHFENLDLITNFLATPAISVPPQNRNTPNIEVLQSHQEKLDETLENEPTDHEKPVMPTLINIHPHQHSYGFNDYYHVIINPLVNTEMVSMIDITNPDEISPKQRRKLRIEKENSQFDASHYLMDYIDGETDPIYQEFLDFEPFWILQFKTFTQLINATENIDKKEEEIKEISFQKSVGFDEKDDEILQNRLKRKEYLIPSNSMEEYSIFLMMFDLLYAFCYTMRFYQNEWNHEALGSFCKLSSCISWMDTFHPPSNEVVPEDRQDNLFNVMRYCLRRSLIYPYLRHWTLSTHVLRDVEMIFQLGRRTILKCFLMIRWQFEHSDAFYLLNTLFVDDCCQWIQMIDDSKLSRFVVNIQNSCQQLLHGAKTSLSPDDGLWTLGLYLPELQDYIMSDEFDESVGIPEHVTMKYRKYEELYSKDQETFGYLITIKEVIRSTGSSVSQNNVEKLFTTVEKLSSTTNEDNGVDKKKIETQKIIEIKNEDFNINDLNLNDLDLD